MTILQEIFSHKRIEIARRMLEKPLTELEVEARQAPPPTDMIDALKGHAHPALIAEIKHRSPSRGLLSLDFDPLSLARIYQENGASAISVLTDEHYFGGSLEILGQVSNQVSSGSNSRLPLLQKDFICDEYQVYEARANRADAILLITAGLDKMQLCDLHSLAVELNMTPLMEVHNAGELQKALNCQSRVMGINNRDLNDFSIHLETVLTLRPYVPPDILVVAESGIHSVDDVTRLEDAGVDAILVGEALVSARDIAAQVRCLAQVDRQNES